MSDRLPPSPGWYRDPYGAGTKRWFDGGGGVGGLRANRIGRLVIRNPWGVFHPARLLLGLAVLGAVLAWGDPGHRAWFVVLTVLVAVGAVIAQVRWVRTAAWYRGLGAQHGSPDSGDEHAGPR